ncbi:MAG: hypothetical protein IJC74_07655 [Clostridia bacterium]|nr:hypothetical protein [Clostridia bacterium]
MKKLFALLLAVIMVFSFAGCGNEDIEVGTNDIEEEVVEEISMIYGDEETPITLKKPTGAFFNCEKDDDGEPWEISTLLADDYSWDGEIMGYKYYEGIGSNEPFVDYYFFGAAVSEDIESFEGEIIDLGISFDGKPVKLIKYKYKEVDYEEEFNECFAGFEYKGAEDCGLMGIKFASFEEALSDDYIKGIFSELFAE